MRKATRLCFAAGLAVLCMAQAPIGSLTPSADCKAFICRKPGTIPLKGEGVSSIQVRKAAFAYSDGSVVSLAPGETVTLGFSKESEKFALVSVSDDAGLVDIGSAPASDMTLVLNLKEDGMTLVLKNATGGPLRYRLARRFASDNGARISMSVQCIPGVIPTVPYDRSQTWLDPSALMLVGDFELLPYESGSSCR